MICKKCKKDLPEEKFSMVVCNSMYVKKDGTVSHYNHSARRKRCNACTWGKKPKPLITRREYNFVSGYIDY